MDCGCKKVEIKNNFVNESKNIPNSKNENKVIMTKIFVPRDENDKKKYDTYIAYFPNNVIKLEVIRNSSETTPFNMRLSNL